MLRFSGIMKNALSGLYRWLSSAVRQREYRWKSEAFLDGLSDFNISVLSSPNLTSWSILNLLVQVWARRKRIWEKRLNKIYSLKNNFSYAGQSAIFNTLLEFVVWDAFSGFPEQLTRLQMSIVLVRSRHLLRFDVTSVWRSSFRSVWPSPNGSTEYEEKIAMLFNDTSYKYDRTLKIEYSIEWWGVRVVLDSPKDMYIYEENPWFETSVALAHSTFSAFTFSYPPSTSETEKYVALSIESTHLL